VSTSVLVAVIAGVVIYSIYCQVRGQALQGTRTALLPAGLIVFGLVDMAYMPAVGPADIACIAASAVVAASLASIIFVLGLNRLAQTGTIAARAVKAGLPIAA
jgi:hypothetical protein